MLPSKDDENHSKMFEKPTSSQDRSPLLALPAEIRTSILKRLVTSTESIPVAHESDSEPQQVHLAVLRVCQQLYHEGFILFLKYNVPRVSITLRHQDAWVIDWHNGRDGPLKAIVYNEFLKDTIPRFSRLRFEFSEAPTTANRTVQRQNIHIGLRKFSRLLMACDLSEKDVTFACNSRIIEFLALDDRNPEWILQLDVVRCKKFHLPGINDTLVDNLTQVVEGRLSASDLKATCREIMQHFDRCRAATGILEGDRGNRLECELKEAAKRYDVARFEVARAAILSRCEELFEEFRQKHEEFKAAAARPLLNES